ncbi:hypothetical protein CHS0354_021318 [Potamilus streckersoni]|uniref:Uncharacterized protein n=1 Tax=Potamilus streckersoni TaxID=2493646 RepID=A0AAE0TL00_9BIVA|nr:hypothetical protein CHS0354_021318 [Potamilus streckersoni]
MPVMDHTRASQMILWKNIQKNLIGQDVQCMSVNASTSENYCLFQQIYKILKDNNIKCAFILGDEGDYRIYQCLGSSHSIEVQLDAVGENGINIGGIRLLEDQLGNLTMHSWGQLQTIFIMGSQEKIERVLEVIQAETVTVSYKINFSQASHQPVDIEETISVGTANP